MLKNATFAWKNSENHDFGDFWWFSCFWHDVTYDVTVTSYKVCFEFWKKYTWGPRYWNVQVLVNAGTFLVYQYCLKMWYLHSLERAGVIQKLAILERKNGLVLSNTRVPVSGTWSILFPEFFWYQWTREGHSYPLVPHTWCFIYRFPRS